MIRFRNALLWSTIFAITYLLLLGSQHTFLLIVAGVDLLIDSNADPFFEESTWSPAFSVHRVLFIGLLWPKFVFLKFAALDFPPFNSAEFISAAVYTLIVTVGLYFARYRVATIWSCLFGLLAATNISMVALQYFRHIQRQVADDGTILIGIPTLNSLTQPWRIYFHFLGVTLDGSLGGLVLLLYWLLPPTFIVAMAYASLRTISTRL